MIEYTSEIHYSAIEDIQIITTGKNRTKFGTYTEQTKSFSYWSINSLRKALVKEKFNAETLIAGGDSMKVLGMGLFIGGILGFETIENIPYFLISFWTSASGLFLFNKGHKLREQWVAEKPKIDSRVKVFNETFTALKPVHFNPRDYLLSVGIPFLLDKFQNS